MRLFIALALLSAFAAPARADRLAVIRDGRTQPLYSYADAVREVVHVETTVDSDGDGRRDRVAVLVTRPREASRARPVAAIVEASPYFAGLIEAPHHPVEVDGQPRLAPWSPPTQAKPKVDYARSHYDNYFVARGYAVLAASSLGTADSEGCPSLTGPDEIQAMKAVVDWLGGRARARYGDGRPATAEWATGAVAMVGNAYNATLALGVAETGVAGLKTIVANVVTANWYDYYRANGGVVEPDGFPGEDADLHAKVVLTRADPARCAAAIGAIERRMDRASGDYNAFWAERDFTRRVDRLAAHGISVFQIAGLSDWNSRTAQFAQLWQTLGEQRVERRLWLYQAGHADILNVRRQEWLDAVQAWLDHWLYGVDSGVDAWPRVQIETAPGQWQASADWPHPAAREVAWRFDEETPSTRGLSLRRDAGADADAGADKPTRPADRVFADAPARSTAELIAEPDRADPNRLLFLSEPLAEDAHLSGTPRIELQASVDGPSPYLSAALIDYGTDTRISGFGPTAQRWCFGDSLPDNPGCKPVYAYTEASTPYHVVTRGWLDVRNRHANDRSEAVRAGERYSLRWPLQPSDYRFKAGHRIGLLLRSSDPGYTLRYPAGTRVSVRLHASAITLPLAEPARPTATRAAAGTPHPRAEAAP